MTQYKVANLSGALLDAAVAECGEWKTAHEHFPTMTLDSTFKGWFIITDSIGETYCLLRPNNPMRQDPRYFSPSTDWAIGGPIIQRERILLEPSNKVDPYPEDWLANIGPEHYDVHYRRTTSYRHTALGVTALIAAMRCYVCSRFGDMVELHD